MNLAFCGGVEAKRVATLPLVLLLAPAPFVTSSGLMSAAEAFTRGRFAGLGVVPTPDPVVLAAAAVAAAIDDDEGGIAVSPA